MGDAAAPVRIEAVREHDRWFVSPVGTALDYVNGFIKGFDTNMLAWWTNQPLESTVIGDLKLNTPRTRLVQQRTDHFDHYTISVDGPVDVGTHVDEAADPPAAFCRTLQHAVHRLYLPGQV